jgi:hypothetical protein
MHVLEDESDLEAAHDCPVVSRIPLNGELGIVNNLRCSERLEFEMCPFEFESYSYLERFHRFSLNGHSGSRKLTIGLYVEIRRNQLRPMLFMKGRLYGKWFAVT